MQKVAVLGAGSWGTAVANLACSGGETVLWARRPELAEELIATRVNSEYLPDSRLSPELLVTASLEEAVSGAELVAVGVPSHGFREVISQIRGISNEVPIISLSKGLEISSLKRMSEVLAEVFPGNPVGVLSGPNLAKEIAAGQPAASVVAMASPSIADDIQLRLSAAAFRVYTNDDVVGCEIAGVMKNVLAIASGMASGLGFGDNTRATLITRGLAEMTRLGAALGANPITFLGLAGIGDLIATCTSPKSRNYAVGFRLGEGEGLAEIIESMHMVAEGVKSTAPVLKLAASVGVELPIAQQVGEVLHDGKSASEVAPALLQREAKSEFHGIRG